MNKKEPLNAGDKPAVNHDDTMRTKLLRSTFDYLRSIGHGIAFEKEDKIMNYLSSASPVFFKELVDRGVSAKQTIYIDEFKQKLNALQLIVIGSLYAKYPTVGDKAKTRDTALLTYVQSELDVQEFNKTLPSLVKTPLYFKVRASLRSLFAGFNAKDLTDDVRFGPGSTSTPGSKLLTEKRAWVARSNGVVLPNDLYNFFNDRGLASKLAIASANMVSKIAHLGERRQTTPKVHLSSTEFQEVISTVPKNAQTDRVISTYPVGVTLISVTTNVYLRKLLKQADMRIEFAHQELSSGYLEDFLRDGNNWENTATLDLKDASGHVSWELLRVLIDNSDVMELLTGLRASRSSISVFVKEDATLLESLIERTEVQCPSNISASFKFGLSHKVVSSKVEESNKDIFERALSEHEWLKTLVTSGIELFYTVSREKKGYRINISFERFSHAGMGSGATFPIMAALIAAIVKESGVSTFRVYGDDIVMVSTTSSEIETVIRNLELFGLVVNRKKSCYGSSSIREAVGKWFYVNQSGLVENFVPFYLRKDLSSLYSLKDKEITNKKGVKTKIKQKCKDLRSIHYAVSMANYLRLISHPGYNFFATLVLQNSAVPISWVPISSGLFGLQVPDAHIWQYYEPVFSDGRLVSVRKRLKIGLSSFTDGSITVERFESNVDVDFDLHYMFIKIKCIQVVPFEKNTPGSFVDDDIRPLTSTFEADPFASALSRLSPDFTSFCDFVAWVKEINSYIGPVADMKVSDRPEKEDQIYFQSTRHLEIPEDIVKIWELG